MTADAELRYVDRHVLPVGESAPLDRDGFLAPPNDDGRWMESKVRPVTDLVGVNSRFVLLAAGGVGKTTVFNWLRSNEDDSKDVVLLGSDKRDIRKLLAKAINAKGSVYLDALDEVALYEPTIFRILEQVLTSPEADVVAWRLACRPAAWSPGLAKVLRASGFEELRLLPLTRLAAREVALTVSADGDRFIDALIKAKLGRLSASPMQLSAAARQWSATGQLPRSHADSVKFEIQRLLSETNDSFPPPGLAGDRQYRLAGRLGAIAVFCGVTAFARSATQVPSALAIADLPSAPEPDEPGVPLQPSHFEEVLKTALFEAAPHATVAFRHHQYAENLAANYIAQRRVARAQIPALLGISAGRLPGPMVGVAAWLAALRPDLTDDLIEKNALAFTRAGVDLPEATRVRVVEGLLAAAGAGDIDPEWSLDLSGLVHPGLEGQLATYMSGEIKDSAEVWWLSQLARAGACVDLLKSVLRLALESSWQSWARRAAIATIGALGDEDDLNELRAVLRLDRESDPDDEVLAGAIDVLYPQLMNTSELLDVLRPRRNDKLVGAYLVLLGGLADRIPSADLPEALSWAADRAGDNGFDTAYGQFVEKLVERAWPVANIGAVREAFADLIVNLLAAHRSREGMRRGEVPWTGGIDIERRRNLTVSVASRLDKELWYRLLRLGLVTRTDTDWLIKELPSLPVPAQEVLAKCVSPLLEEPTATEADQILSLSPSHPAYEETRWWREPVLIESEMAERLRKYHLLEKRDNIDHAAAEAHLLSRLSAALNEARSDVLSWWRVAYWLGKGDEPGENLFTHDLKMRPGWRLLADDDQQLVIELGLRYVQEQRISPLNWVGKETITTDKVLPDWSGVYLLTTLARHDPERIKSLKPAIWKELAPAIVGAWNYDNGPDARLRCDLVDLAPTDGRVRIIDAAIGHLDALAANDRHLTPYPLFDYLCADLAPMVAERLAAGRYDAQLGRSLLDLLIRHLPTAALEVCQELCASQTSSLSAVARQKLAELDAAGTLDSLISDSRTVDEIADIVPRLNFTELDDVRLVSLCRLLLDSFPVAEDPPEEIVGFASNAFEARWVRNRVLRLLGERGQVRALETLAESRTGIDRIMISYYLREARNRAADLAYVSPQPHSLFSFLGRADARLIRHSGDLLDVVVEQLREVQHYLTHGGGFRDVWNVVAGHEPCPNSEDDISDWVCRQLQSRLSGGSLIDREVQVARLKSRGVGTRIDLTATSPTIAYPAGIARVIAEAKLVNHNALYSALDDQLVQRYLMPTGLQHAVYLVYWVASEQRPRGWSTKLPADPVELLRILRQQATAVTGDFEIRPFVLDISRPRFTS